AAPGSARAPAVPSRAPRWSCGCPSRRQESEMSTTSGNPPTRLRVVVVDDHSLVRSGVRSELEAHAPDLAIVGEAADVESAVAVVHQTVPDVVLLDVHLPGGRGGGGIDVITGCRDVPSRFLALSVSDSSEDVVGVIRAGARGYVTKAISPTEPDDSVRSTAGGDAD